MLCIGGVGLLRVRWIKVNKNKRLAIRDFLAVFGYTCLWFLYFELAIWANVKVFHLVGIASERSYAFGDLAGWTIAASVMMGCVVYSHKRIQ